MSPKKPPNGEDKGNPATAPERHNEDLMGLERDYREALSALNDQHRTFVIAYLKDLNGAEAARQAGCSEKSARVTASKWLTRANISRALEAGKRLREMRLSLSADMVITGLIAARNQSMAAAPVFNARGQVVDGIWQYDSLGAIKANELLAKHLGMFGSGKDGAISLEVYNQVTGQMGVEVLAAIRECVDDEATCAALIASIDRRWSAISVSPAGSGGKRTP